MITFDLCFLLTKNTRKPLKRHFGHFRTSIHKIVIGIRHNHQDERFRLAQRAPIYRMAFEMLTLFFFTTKNAKKTLQIYYFRRL